MWWKKPAVAPEESIECREATALLERYLDGRLAPETAEAFEAHLAVCAECRRLVREEPLWLGRLQQWPPRQRLTAIEAAAIRQGLYRRLRWRMIVRNTKTAMQGAVAFAVLLVIVGMVVWWQQQDDRVTTLDPQPPAQPATTIITFAAPASQERLYSPLMEQFQEAYPTLAVQFVPLDESNSPAAAQIATMADTAVLPTAVAREARHHFRDLEPLQSSDGDSDAVDFWPGILQGCQTDNVQIGLPIRAYLNLILYNQAAFDQAGLAYPEPGWTWRDFQAIIRALAVPGERYGYLEASPIRTLAPFIAPLLAGSELDAGQLAAQLQWYLTLADQGLIGGAELIGDIPTLISQGQVAMWADNLSILHNEWRSLDFDVGVVPFPANSDSQATTPLHSICAVISAGSQQPAAAWRWLDFLSRNPPADFQYGLPARISTADAENYWSRLRPETAVAVRFAAENGWYGQRQPGLAEVGSALETAINDGGALLEAIAATLGTATAVAEVPTPDATPAVVASPRPTATPAPVGRPPGVASAVYFVSSYYHTSFEAIAALAEAFNRENQDIYIEVTDDRSAFESGFEDIFAVNNYDCFASISASILPFGDPPFSELVYSLDPFLDAEEASFLADFDPAQLEAARSLDGQLYGLPVADKPPVLYYNASHLEERGLEPPPLDWNMADFWALAEAATGESHYGFLALPLRSANVLEIFMTEAGVHYYDSSGAQPRANFADPDLISLLNQLGKLAQDNVLYPYDQGGTRSAMGNSRSFTNIIRSGQGIMWVAEAGVPRGLPLGLHNLVSGFPQYEIGVAPLPVDTTWLLRDGTSLFISRRAENPHVCWEWFKFLSGQPTAAFQGIPARRSVVESAAWETAVGQAQAEAYRATLARMTYSAAFPPEPPVPLWQWWQDALAAILIDGADAGDVLRETQAKAQATLDCMVAAGADPTVLDVRGDTHDTAIACAYDMDPDFRSQDELSREEFGSGP